MRNSYKLIACSNQAGVIGKEGKLLYSIKADMTNFKSLTIGNVVIMGRKTFESLPHHKPLKNRINIIVTRNIDYSPIGSENWTKEEINSTFLVNSLEEVDDLCYAYFDNKELFIIGGGEIYKEAYEKGMIDEAILTVVSDDTEGDAYLPEFDKDKSYRVIFRTTTLRDHPGDIYYKYMVYKKIKEDKE